MSIDGLVQAQYSNHRICFFPSLLLSLSVRLSTTVAMKPILLVLNLYFNFDFDTAHHTKKLSSLASTINKSLH